MLRQVQCTVTVAVAGLGVMVVWLSTSLQALQSTSSTALQLYNLQALQSTSSTALQALVELVYKVWSSH